MVVTGHMGVMVRCFVVVVDAHGSSQGYPELFTVPESEATADRKCFDISYISYVGKVLGGRSLVL